MPAPTSMTITLQQLMERLESEATLSLAQRSELRSAIRRFAQICGKHPCEIIADPAVIRQWINKASWQMAGLSKGGWANLTSRLTRAMKTAGIKVHRRRRNFKLASDWDALLSPMSQRDRDELHRFAGWCSVHSIKIEDVSAAAFDKYLNHLETETIQRNPRERWHVARRVWNKAVAGQAGSGFPSIPNNEPDGWRGLPWSAFPKTLLRRRNFSALRINHSLQRDHVGLRVLFTGKETKKGRRIDFHYPDWLTEPFDVYVSDVRPVLLSGPQGRDEGWLWVGRRGRPLSPHSVTTNITTLTKRHLDRAVSPHLFRDCAATDIALLDPEHVGITKSILGHATLASSEKHYNQATSFSAIRRLDTVLSGLRED